MTHKEEFIKRIEEKLKDDNYLIFPESFSIWRNLPDYPFRISGRSRRRDAAPTIF